MSAADPADTVREKQLERITRAFEFVPLNLYDEITKLAEAALGEILDALDALEVQAERTNEDKWGDLQRATERIEAAEAECNRLREALMDTKRTLAFEQDGEWYTVGPGAGLAIRAVGIIDAALATDRTEAQP